MDYDEVIKLVDALQFISENNNNNSIKTENENVMKDGKYNNNK